MKATTRINSYSRVLSWSLALLVSALAAGCGSGGSGGQDPILGGGGSPNLAPTVTATSPASNATGVPVSSRTITATFSEAMNASTLTLSSFSVACPTGTPQTGTSVVYGAANTATLTLTNDLPANTTCTGTITTAAQDTAGLGLASNFTWNFSTTVDGVRPTVLTVTPANGACLSTEVGATFSEAMDPSTINTTTFTLQLTGPPLGTALAGSVAYDVPTKVATFTPTGALLPSTSYTATITTGAKDLAGNTLLANRTWTFVTGTLPCTPAPPPPPPPIGTTAGYGILAGTAGTTNMGILTVINGSLATTSTTTSAVTGFHDSAGDFYTITGSNNGAVTGKMYTCTVSITGPTSAAVNPANCTIATQAKLDAQTLYNSLSPASLPGGIDPGAGQLGGKTLAPGVYKAASGSFLLTGSDLTLDAQGNSNAVWVFQTASSLTVGAAAAPRNVILSNGALAKNVYWRVGTAATINAAGGGTMVGKVLASAGVSTSTAGNVALVTVDGSLTSLNASVTVVNTVINVPAP